MAASFPQVVRDSSHILSVIRKRSVCDEYDCFCDAYFVYDIVCTCGSKKLGIWSSSNVVLSKTEIFLIQKIHKRHISKFKRQKRHRKPSLILSNGEYISKGIVKRKKYSKKLRKYKS